jgi:hypothetical protein
VLNAARPGWGDAARHGEAQHEGVRYPMRWSPGLMGRLAGLHHERVVEFRWATTWVDEIGRLEALFGLPSFAVAFAGLADGPQAKTPELKLAAAHWVIEVERRPLIWTDDDAIPVDGPDLHRLQSPGVPTLLLAPDPRRGLEPPHLQAISDFLADPDVLLHS